jgi:hypothetical protein
LNLRIGQPRDLLIGQANQPNRAGVQRLHLRFSQRSSRAVRDSIEPPFVGNALQLLGR